VTLETAFTLTAKAWPDRSEVTAAVPTNSPPVTVRIIRDGHVIHEFTEPGRPSQSLPANSNESQGEAA
jgi:hypothetical protein